MLRRLLRHVFAGAPSPGSDASPPAPVREAEIELAGDNPARAERILATWVEAHPDDVQALRLHGNALNRLGRHREALDAAQRALELRDEHSVREELAHAHVGLGNVAAAFSVFAPVLSGLSGQAIDAVKQAHARVSGELDPAEMAATLRSAFLMLKNDLAAVACDRLLRRDEGAAGEYRVFEILPSLLDYCQRSQLRWQVASDTELLPMGKTVPAGSRAHGFIGELPEGMVIGQTFVPAAAEGFAFTERFLHNPGRVALWNRSIPSDTVCGYGGTRLLTCSSGLDRYAGDHLLVGNLANVGHWLLNHLARLWWLERMPGLGRATIVIGSNAWDTQIECLVRMGVDRERILRIPEGRIAQFERLWAPAMLYCTVGKYLYWWPGVIPFLRERLGMEFAPQRKRRIFVTRRGARWRRMLNEEKVLEALAPFGFEVVDPGALSVAEQIELAGSAQVIAGAFGAGMMLLMFAAPGTPIIEFKYDVGNSMDLHPVIARAIGLPYLGVTGSTHGHEPDRLKQDFLIAPQEARNAVAQALELSGV